MDSACDTGSFIIAVRGGRAYQCDRTTGTVNFQTGSPTLPDFQQVSTGMGLGLSPSSIVFSSAVGRCFATCWNSIGFDTTTGLAVRKIYRIIPSSLLVDLVIDVTTNFGVAMAPNLQSGIGVLKIDGNTIYGMGNTGGTAIATVFKFDSTAPGITDQRNFGGEYASFAESGDVVYFNAIAAQDVESWNFGTATHTNGPLDTRNRLAIEFAAGQLYCTELFEFIDIYDTAGNFISQIDTGRTGFNGVSIRLNPNNGLLYIAGGQDNTVYTMTTGGTLSTVKSGFDLPWDFVFAGAKTFAVQQGTVGLREVI